MKMELQTKNDNETIKMTVSSMARLYFFIDVLVMMDMFGAC